MTQIKIETKLKKILLKDIDPHECFQIRYNRDHRILQASLTKYGVLNPPYVVQKDKSFQVLDGATRVQFLRDQGSQDIECFVIDAESTKDSELFLFFLELNQWSHGLNLVEKAQAIQIAQKLFGGLNVPKEFWDKMGIKPNIKTVHQYKEVLKLPDVAKKYAVNNNTPLAVILILLRFPAQDIETLCARLFVLPLNQNKLAEVLAMLLDISKRERVSPLEVIDSLWPEIDTQGSAQQKEQILRHELHKRRNPMYEKQLVQFEEVVKKLAVPDHTKLSPPPFFHDHFVHLESKIFNHQDLQKLIALLQSDEWDELL